MNFKVLIPSVAFCGLFCFAAAAQKNSAVQTIAALLEKSQVFLDYRKFRTNFEQMNGEAGQHLYYREDYIRLNVAYNEIEEQYNGLLITIQKDLSNFHTIQLMIEKPQQYALRYLDEYNNVIHAYQNNYLPVYRLVTSPEHSSLAPGKAVTPGMIILGVEVFLKIVDLIKTRNGDQNASENSVLASINSYFIQKIAMKPWSELQINPPGKKMTNDPDPILQKTKKKQKNRELKGASFAVNRPVLDQLDGWIEFNYTNAKGVKKMNFAKENGKDIGIEVLKTTNGQVNGTEKQVKVAKYRTSESFSEGTQFQLKVRNSGGMYVFALNNGNQIQFLYPYNSESLRDCDQKLGTGKDIGVLPSSFLVGRDRNKVTTLPAPDCSASTPLERYFTITAPMPAERKEQFCVLLTRSELNTAQLAKVLERASGDLSNRLATVFGQNMISANTISLKLANNRIEFDANNASQYVLPIIINILRK